jgi:MFS family permease
MLSKIPRETWTVFAITTIGNVGWSATLPFYAVYLVSRNVSLTEIGLTYLATGLLLLVTQILSGRLVDEIGPKKVMLLAYSISLGAALLLGRLIQVSAPITWLLLLYPLFSLTRNMPASATSAIMASQAGVQMWTGFSFLNVGNNLGFAIGPAVAGIFSQYYGYSTVFFFAAGSAVVADLITLLLLHYDWQKVSQDSQKSSSEDVINRQTVRKWLSWKEDRTVILFLLLVLGSFFAIGYEIQPMSVYVSDFLGFSNSQIGYLFTTNGLVIVILQLPFTRWWQRSMTKSKLVVPLILSSIFAAIAYLIVAFGKTFGELELAMVVLTVGEIFQTVPSQMVTALFSRPGNRGTYQGYYNAVTSAGRSVAFYVGPASFALFSVEPYISWILIAVFTLLTGLAFLFLSPSLQRDYAKLKGAEDEKLLPPK